MKEYRIDVYDFVLEDYVGPGIDPWVNTFDEARTVIDQLRTIWRDDTPAYFRIVEVYGRDGNQRVVWADDLPTAEERWEILHGEDMP